MLVDEDPQDGEGLWLVPDADRARMPAPWLTGREWRTAVELLSLSSTRAVVDTWPRGDGHPVLVLPGFMAGKESTIVLRRILRDRGYYVHDWGLGRNLGLRPGLAEGLRDRMEDLNLRHGRTISLVGWSAGGIYAREIARDRPDLVRQVITMGSPFRGNHEATRAWRFYRFMAKGPELQEKIAEQAKAERARPLDVPTTCIFSRTDGIVAWECCTSVPAPRTENVEVRSTHLGYGHNLETLAVVVDRLAQPEGRWVPYAGRAAVPRSGGPRAGGRRADPA